jgi:hypothetical protein
MLHQIAIVLSVQQRALRNSLVNRTRSDTPPAALYKRSRIVITPPHSKTSETCQKLARCEASGKMRPKVYRIEDAVDGEVSRGFTAEPNFGCCFQTFHVRLISCHGFTVFLLRLEPLQLPVSRCQSSAFLPLQKSVVLSNTHSIIVLSRA